jgi:MAP/microtubule affinity-regulating kinase
MKILRSGAYDVPAGIGRSAERVLENCLQRSVHLRWTIDMVDDVAWGVGWGAEGDDISVEPELISCSYSKSRSSSPRTTPPDTPWQQDELRPSLETAHRRSEDRIRRSSSRTPCLMDRSSRPRISRSQSRQKLNQATPARIHTSIPYTHSSITSPSLEDMSLPMPLMSFESERGRRPVTNPGSRSPSPSLVPVTPSDLLEDRFFDSFQVLDSKSSSDDLEDETFARGRKSVGQSRPSHKERVHRKVSRSQLEDVGKVGKGDGGVPSPHATRDPPHKDGRCRASSAPTFGLKDDGLPSALFLHITPEPKDRTRGQSRGQSLGGGLRRR